MLELICDNEGCGGKLLLNGLRFACEKGWCCQRTLEVAIDDEEAREIREKLESHDELLQVLEDLYKHCAMVHRYWGDGGNQKEADDAKVRGASILKKFGRG